MPFLAGYFAYLGAINYVLLKMFNFILNIKAEIKLSKNPRSN